MESETTEIANRTNTSNQQKADLEIELTANDSVSRINGKIRSVMANSHREVVLTI